MGKFKKYNPYQIAGKALDNLVNKVPEMIEKYRERMENFTMDAEAQERYRNGVAEWISIMRMPEVRNKIAEAIEIAKKKKRKIEETVRGRVARPIAVPVR